MHEKYMKRALELASKGKGKVSPNPMVGAVIVKNSDIISEGYHIVYGKEHAEINALKNTTECVEDSTMYVTLEPCSHFGKTPPCVEEIIKNKISKVVIGCLDPNPLVSGKGVKKLKENGIEVVVGVLEEECRKLNEVFFKYICAKKPFITMKCAMSLDGKIATNIGESRWISCELSRRKVHKLRNEVSGIMVGVDTVIKDNPQLTCRLENGRNPIRIIVDSKLRIPIESKVVQGTDIAKTIVATTNMANKNKISELIHKGVQVIVTNIKNERVDLEELMTILAKNKIDSILLEGGASLNYSALEEGIVDKVQIYIAPKIIGGKDAKTPVAGEGVELLEDAFRLCDITTKSIGDDIFIEGYIKRGDEKCSLA
ncbi:MAG: bifunctional diaminohydroxyphosphoribosylaminopyrimidine deaminase/5-amino-6-(5-phosphoribosylamino)uracil reductase RibD [Peptostreptococcaceae bacterium]